MRIALSIILLGALIAGASWFSDPAKLGSVTYVNGPLDLVTTNQFSAVSFYYALSKDYTGDLFRLREDGSNNETNIGVIRAGKYRIADTNGIASWCGTNNGLIVYGIDQTGNGRNLTNATAARQPMIYDGSAILLGETGIPCVTFDGTDDFLKWSGTLNQPDTFFDVMEVDTAWVASGAITDGGTPFHVVQMANPGVADDVRLFAGASLGDIQVPPDIASILVAVFNGTSSVLQKNNESPLNGNAGTAAAAGITWANYGNVSFATAIRGYELIVFDAALGTNAYGLLIDSANTRYGVY